MSDDDAEEQRVREVVEERASRRERLVESKRSLADYLGKKVSAAYTPKVVRNWVLGELTEPSIIREYEIGHGITTFATPTAMGNIVQVEAPPVVQRAALQHIISLGLPTQVGLVDDEGNQLPGVIALGAYDMEAAQELAHGPRFAAHGGIAGAIEGALHEGDRVADVLPPSSGSQYELPAEHELVMVEEGIGSVTQTSEDRPPEPVSEEPTPEQVVLARHRERMKKAKHKPVPAAPSSITENLRD